jgi:hypothetical protein
MRQNVESIFWSIYSDEADEDAIVASARSMTNQSGFRVMHRRNGQYWLMFAEPMTIYDIAHFFASGFKVINGEPGHFNFEPVPDNARGEQYTPEVGRAYYTGWRGPTPAIETSLRELKSALDWELVADHFERCCQYGALRERVWAAQHGHTVIRLDETGNVCGFG